MSRWMIRFARTFSFAVILVPMLLVGCGPKTGSVSGKVVFKQKPLPGGQVSLIDSKGKTHGGEIAESGDYSVKELLPGTYQVAVDNQMLKMISSMPKLPGGGLPEGAPKQKGMYVPIPEKFVDAKTSGLTVTIGPGSQSQDIELK